MSLILGGQSIVQDISLEVLPGEMVSLIGLNGSGKSTLLKLMAGIYKPSSGTLMRRAKRIGYVPQVFEFDRTIPFSVLELLKTYTRATASQIQEKLKEVNALSFLHQNIGELSGGQTQRVLIANALLGQPDLLLLDEPTAGLDLIGEKDFYCTLEDIHQSYGMAIVIVSHDIHLVLKHSKKIFCVDHSLVCHGHPDEVKKNEGFIKLFGPHFIPFKHHEHDDSHS